MRRFALAAHLAVSIGWLGAVAAYIALDVTAATSEDPQALRSAYSGMDAIARYVIVPLAISTLLTGLVMSLGTKWGLLRHYWVLVSFVLTAIATTVLLVEMQAIGAFARMATDPTTPDEHLRTMGSTLVHSIGGIVVLLVVLALNLYKPEGMTRYGWRKQAEEPGARRVQA